LTFEEGNKSFKDFLNQNLLNDEFTIDNGMRVILNSYGSKYSLQDLFLDQGIFEFILKRKKHSLIDSILKRVDDLAKSLCCKKAKRITNFLEAFPSLGSLESEYKVFIYQTICAEFIRRNEIPSSNASQFVQGGNDSAAIKKFYEEVTGKFSKNLIILVSELSYLEDEIKLFKELFEYIFLHYAKNWETRIFFTVESNSQILKEFLGSPKGDKILAKLQEKGLFFVIANYFIDWNVQKILRILDSRLRVFCTVQKTSGDLSGRFWESLVPLKDEENIEQLGLILLRYTFNQHSQSENFFSQINNRDLDTFKELLLKHKAKLIDWHLKFAGFASPSFANPGEEALVLRDLGLNKKEMVSCAIGKAMYRSFFEDQSFKKTFEEIKLEGIDKIFDIVGSNSEHISKMDFFAEVFIYLNMNDKYYFPQRVLNYFYQHISFYKSARQSELMKEFYKKMPSSLKKFPLTAWDNPKPNDYNPEIATKIMKILVKAYFGESREKINDADFLSKQTVLDSVIYWMGDLSTSFYQRQIHYNDKKRSRKFIHDVLNNLNPDRCGKWSY
jgi:hypothetical protein